LNGEENLSKSEVIMGQNRSAIPWKVGLKNMILNCCSFSLVIHNRMLTLSDLIARYDMIGTHTTYLKVLKKSSNTPQIGCGLTTMKDPIWALAA
jgi:hypothetical protein